jgi:hypothetical protein
MDRCDCGHRRSSHAAGLWECKWCQCREYREPVVPDIFEDDGENEKSKQAGDGTVEAETKAAAMEAAKKQFRCPRGRTLWVQYPLDYLNRTARVTMPSVKGAEHD